VLALGASDVTLMKDGIVRCVNGLRERPVHGREKEISRRDAEAQSEERALVDSSSAFLFVSAPLRELLLVTPQWRATSLRGLTRPSLL